MHSSSSRRLAISFLPVLLALPPLAGSAADRISLSTRTVLSAGGSDAVAEAAQAEARKQALAVSIAIVDDAGQLMSFRRMEGAPVSSVHLSIAKAASAARYRAETKVLEDLVNTGQHNAILGLPDVVPVEGGVPLLNGSDVIGAIGISGAKRQQDGAIARQAAAALAP